MKIIKPSVRFYGAVPVDEESNMKTIEMAGRLCYKSEGRITKGSARPFATRLIKAKHYAMVEHSNFVVHTCLDWESIGSVHAQLGNFGKFLRVEVDIQRNRLCIGGSLRAWAEVSHALKAFPPSFLAPFNSIYGDLFGLSKTDAFKDKWEATPFNEIIVPLHRYVAKFICDRGVTHELVRHRPCSFAQESTRYVDYEGKDMEFIEPWWYNEGDNDLLSGRKLWRAAMTRAEESYRLMRELGHSPQAARAVLPNSVKTEIFVTADKAEWLHIFSLRIPKDAQPDMRRVMTMCKEESGW